MTQIGKSSDASFYYYEDTSVDVARMDSSAVYGNLADAMKNATVVFTPPHLVETMVVSPIYEAREHAKQTDEYTKSNNHE